MENKIKYLILGAGPAGLTLGRILADHGEKDLLIVEKEKEAGGLCRSVTVDGAPFDIGGGHFLDVRDRKVCDFLFRFLPEKEWNRFDRDSRIRIHGMEVSHPFEANLWQLPEALQETYLASIKKAGCNRGIPQPTRFTDWIRWKLGDRIAEDYMLPYNRKLFADDLDKLGTYWLSKLPNVSYEETLQSVRDKKPYGTQPGHAAFYYPKEYGYGEVFLRIAQSLEGKIRYEAVVTEVDLSDCSVTLSDGSMIKAEHIITTIPWTSFVSRGLPVDILSEIGNLRSSAVETHYVPDDPGTEAHWVYVPDESIPYHRILCRKNFFPGSRGYWQEKRYRKEFPDERYPKDHSFSYLNEYAYPLNTIDKPAVMKRLLTYASKQNVIGLGRWGEHEHFNSDVVIKRAMDLAERLSS